MNQNVNNNSTITAFEFCAGYGGLCLGLERVFGESLQVIGYCEFEGFAQANLISKMEQKKMDVAPVWSDLASFPYRKFRGLVDIACAGIPCQPHSVAGKRKGGADERFLFDIWLDGLAEMQPRYIFIENVEGFLSSKMPDGTLCFQYTIERLERMDYEVTAGIFSAAEVGAPHQRKRVFILAYSGNTRPRGINRQAGCETGSEILRQKNRKERSIRVDATGSGEELADTDQPGPQGRDIEELSECSSQRPAWPSSSFWPARPGEKQYEWEEPRVVGYASRKRPSQRTRGSLGGQE